MSEPGLPGRSERVVVALDSSPQSEKALRAAVELATLLDAELEGLFVEDINLMHLCGLPFGFMVATWHGATGWKAKLNVLAGASSLAVAALAWMAALRA